LQIIGMRFISHGQQRGARYLREAEIATMKIDTTSPA
jgi:hypothetical protein